MLYDMTLKFESEILVNPFDKEFSVLLSTFGCGENNFGKITKVDHMVDIKNSPVVPDNSFIATIKENIFEALTETFKTQKDINAVVRSVKFIGITQIETKETTI